jgi:DNA-binding NarL/FixJ family response regulator
MDHAEWPFFSAAGADKPIRILIADDHRLGAEAMAAVIKLRDGYEVDCVSTLNELLKRLNGDTYDLVVLDTRMPLPLSVPYLQKIATAIGDTRLFLLFDEPNMVFQHKALAAGASGAAPKTMPLDRFLAAISLVLAGETFAFAHPSMDAGSVSNDEKELSQSEQVYLSLASRGYTDKEIALDVNHTVAVVKAAFRKIRHKLNARDRTQAVMKAVDRGIIE